jgi:hypothetical protein
MQRGGGLRKGRDDRKKNMWMAVLLLGGVGRWRASAFACPKLRRDRGVEFGVDVEVRPAEKVVVDNREGGGREAMGNQWARRFWATIEF